MTSFSTLEEIREKAGIIIRDLLRNDATLLSLMGRDAEDCIHYSRVDSKHRFNKIFPYLRIDLNDARLVDSSNNGERASASMILQLTAMDYDSLNVHKIADRADTVVATSHSSLKGNCIMTLTSSGTSSYDEPNPEGKTVSYDVVRFTLEMEGKRAS